MNPYTLLRRMRRRIRLAVLQRRGLRIGRDCRIFGPLPHIMNEPYLVSIGNHCTISCGVAFITHDGATWLFRDEPEYRNLRRYAAIEIRDDCFIGARAIILPGVTVGPNAIVGAGAVVTEDVAPNTVVAGNPAHFICTMDQYKEKMLQKGMRLSARSRAELRRKLEAILDRRDATEAQPSTVNGNLEDAKSRRNRVEE